MSDTSRLAQSYDATPFPTSPLREAHPDQLAAVATLLGMTPPAIERCRVLEIGCGTGGNLLPMADRHPDSRFLGIDLSAVQIEQAKSIAQGSHLANVELRQFDLMDIDESWGKFDYIIAHGVYSWVPRPVQDRILELCRDHLSAQGIAYISYNVYPGWYWKGINRELMQCAALAGTPPARRMQKARCAMEFVSKSLAASETMYGRVVKDFIDAALAHEDSYLLHEYLEDENEPLYFHEFIQRASGLGLRDATPPSTLPSRFGDEVRERLERVSSGEVSTEQHIDVLRNRTFRQTLLCHAEVAISREPDPLHFMRLFVASKGRQGLGASETSCAPSHDTTASGGSPELQAALAHLAEIWPRGTSFEELFSAVANRLAASGGPRAFTGPERDLLVWELMRCAGERAIDLRSGPDQFVTTVSDRPTVGSLARVQARTSQRVTNRRHDSVLLDDIAQRLVPDLDGQHDRESLVRRFVEAVDRKQIILHVGGVPATSGSSALAAIEWAINDCLNTLANECLLVA